jgi:glycosyltransferase involved in cell wall biosynthesis
MIKILHIVENYSLSSGGVRTIVKSLVEELENYNFSSFILTSIKEKDDENVFVVDAIERPWLYSSNWKKKIETICKEEKIDCIHIHGTWMFPQFMAAKFSVNNKIPFVLSPHGMYEPWLWEKGTFKKKMYFKFLVKKYFKKATILHAITTKEKKNLNKLFETIKIVEIPNLIKNKSNQVLGFVNQDKYILYIGRLDEVKGIDLLIKSFIKINPKNFKLKIAGKYNSYKNELDNIIKNAKFDTSKIEFLNFIDGAEKEQIIKNAFVVVAPSHSEVIGMVNLEAAILMTPVITTFQTGLNKSWNNNGGVLINPDIKELVSSLRKVLSWTDKERVDNGLKLYNFVVNNYSWENKINDWEELYKATLK